MLDIACINDQRRRIPTDVYDVDKITQNKHRRIKAAITSTAAKTKKLCNVAYKAHVSNWEKEHVKICKKEGWNPDGKQYVDTIGDIYGH